MMTTVHAKTKYQASMQCLSWKMLALHCMLRSQPFSIHVVFQRKLNNVRGSETGGHIHAITCYHNSN